MRVETEQLRHRFALPFGDTAVTSVTEPVPFEPPEPQLLVLPPRHVQMRRERIREMTFKCLALLVCSIVIFGGLRLLLGPEEILPVFGGGLGILVPVFVITYPRAHSGRDLVRYGRTVPGEIIDKWRNTGSGLRSWHGLKYLYQVPGEYSQVGIFFIPWPSWACGAGNVGETVTVLYDPQDSSRSIIYAVADFKAAGPATPAEVRRWEARRSRSLTICKWRLWVTLLVLEILVLGLALINASRHSFRDNPAKPMTWFNLRGVVEVQLLALVLFGMVMIGGGAVRAIFGGDEVVGRVGRWMGSALIFSPICFTFFVCIILLLGGEPWWWSAAPLMLGLAGLALLFPPMWEWYYAHRAAVEAAKVLAAARAGNVNAQYRLGGMYSKGLGVKKDYAAAIEWYRKAAEQGHATAAYLLGLTCANGLGGIVRDDVAAVQWFQKAAEQGYASAQFDLGVMYDSGRGVAQDNPTAAHWYQKAAVQGNASAQCNLGVMYMNGCGVVQDDAAAVQWFKKSTDQGNLTALRNLRILRANGRGDA